MPNDTVLIIEPNFSGHRWRYAEWAANAYMEAGYRCLIVTDPSNGAIRSSRRSGRKTGPNCRSRSSRRPCAAAGAACRSGELCALSPGLPACLRKCEPRARGRARGRALRRLLLLRAAVSGLAVRHDAVGRHHDALELSSRSGRREGAAPSVRECREGAAVQARDPHAGPARRSSRSIRRSPTGGRISGSARQARGATPPDSTISPIRSPMRAPPCRAREGAARARRRQARARVRRDQRPQGCLRAGRGARGAPGRSPTRRHS